MNNYKYTDKEVELVIDCAKKSAWKISCGEYEKFEDYYSVALIGATKAIKTYNKDSGVLLKTYAYTCTRNEIFRYLKKKSIVADMYLDDILTKDSDPLYVKDTIRCSVDIEDNVIYNDLLDIVYNDTKNIFTKTENKVIRLLVENPYSTQQEIANTLKCSRQNVSELIKKIKNKIYKLLYTIEA